MSSSKEVVHKRRCLKRLSINDIISKGRPKDDYYINSSRNKRPRGGSEGIKSIFETTSFIDCPLCIARWRCGGTNSGGFEISVSWAAAREDSSVSMV